MGTRCAAVCQNALPYPNLHDPFQKHRGFWVTYSKPYRTTPTAVVVPVEPIVLVVVVMPSAVLGNSSDSEYVDTPFFVPHFYLDCTAGGPSVSAELSTCALIDDSSDAVLIDPEFADCLGLA